jgi:hypothetical protein
VVKNKSVQMKKVTTLFLFCILLISNTIKAQSGESPIKLELPETTYIGAQVPFSGLSVMYKDFKTVKIAISGPKNYVSALEQKLDKEGNFKSFWTAPLEFGVYTFIATSSDGKANDTSKISIESIDLMDKMADESIVQLDKAKKEVDAKEDKVKKDITADDKKQLDEKLAKFNEGIQQYKNVMIEINDAMKQIKALPRPKEGMPEHVIQHLSELKQAMLQQEAQLKRIKEFSSHLPNKATVCDYINALKETLQAYTTVVGFSGKAIATVLGKLAENKPKKPELFEAKKKLGIETAKMVKNCFSKTADFTKASGPIGLITTCLDFIVDQMAKRYCISFSNNIKQENHFTFTNEFNEVWYEYKTRLEGVLSLRAPKANNSTNVIKMRGSIEGNLTEFNLVKADPKACIAKELKDQGVYSKTEWFPVVQRVPAVIPFSIAQNDKAGFGKAARMIATPSCFNIPVDAEYNPQTKEIKIFIIKENASDFSSQVKVNQLFVYYAFLPMAQYQDYPVEKAAVTMFANFKEKNNFSIIDKSKDEKTFSGTVKRTVTGGSFKIDLSVTIEPEK